jgi:hypothetical protein
VDEDELLERECGTSLCTDLALQRVDGPNEVGV